MVFICNQKVMIHLTWVLSARNSTQTPHFNPSLLDLKSSVQDYKTTKCTGALQSVNSFRYLFSWPCNHFDPRVVTFLLILYL